jgi:uncharacterized oxidoreductase
MHLSGHRVLITGGSMGIGFALAKAFHDRENQITISARRAGPLEEAARQLPGVHTVVADMTEESDLRHMVAAATDHMGGISLLVNNAGLQWNDQYDETEIETILDHADSEIGTNLTGLVKLTALALPVLKREETAAIVNVSSVLAIAPKRSAPVYCATKAAVHSFTMALRYQLAESARNVTVFEVLPPGVDTAMTAGRQFRKMSPDDLATVVINGMARDKTEIYAGQARILRALHRVSPKAAYRTVKKR